MEKESHLLELARYVVLNPVRAEVVKHPSQYRWSSYRATAGEEAPATSFTVEWILSSFDADVSRVRAAYRRFVNEGRGGNIREDVKGGVLLGREEFVTRMGPLLREARFDSEIRRRERFADRRSLDDIFFGVTDERRLRNRRIHEAVMKDGHTLKAVSKHLGLHLSMLSRIDTHVEDEASDARNRV